MENGNYLIGRQPILNRQEQVCAYELLFRSSRSLTADVTDASFATASVIINTLSGFGIEELLGGHPGFINVELDLLLSDALEILPKELVVLELLETLAVTDALVERCRELKNSGFRLALDDHEFSPVYQELYNIVDIVKVDLMQSPVDRLGEMVKQFRHYPVKLLAEKVESRLEFQACLNLGFDYFQGYYFAKPAVIEKRRIDEASATLLKLLRLLMDNTELDKIEATFRGSPGLVYKLLLLVNSVAIGSREKITTVRHAITMLGWQQIKRWVQLALFASNDSRGLDNPLVDMAAVRAGFMEQLVRSHPKLNGHKEAADQAFITGILSLLEVIYDISTAEVVKGLNLSEEISAALLEREGDLGRLLSFAETIERLDLDAAHEQLMAMGLTNKQVLDAQRKAFKWKIGV